METNLSSNDEGIVRCQPLSHGIFCAQAGADAQDSSQVQEPHNDQADSAPVSGRPRPGFQIHDACLAGGS